MRRTGKRLRGGFAAGAAAIALGLSVAPAAHASGPSTAPTGSVQAGIAHPAGNPPCGTIYGDVDNGGYTWTSEGSGYFWNNGNVTVDVGGVYAYNIRTGVSSACSIIGTIGVGEAFNYDCTLTDTSGRTWTELHTSEKERGWVLDIHLPDGGSAKLCPK